MNSDGPALDISPLSFPVRKEDVFPGGKPLVLEIGFGEGEFLISAARGDKTRNYLGLEIKRGRFRKAVRAAGKLSLENLKFVHIEAETALRQVFGRRMFELAVVNFPDPWPKKKHSKHRIFNREFIGLLAEALEADGRVAVRTDQISYIEQVVSEFGKSGLFRPAYPPPCFVEPGREEIETKFERRFREASQRIFSAVFVNRPKRSSG